MWWIRRKKTRADRDAGLVFRWRGGYASNTGGNVIGFLIVSLVFVAAFTLLDVELKRASQATKRTGRVQFLLSDATVAEMDAVSPFVARWDPASDSEVEQRLAGKLRDQYGRHYVSKVGWQKLPQHQYSALLPTIYQRQVRFLPDLDAPVREPAEPSGRRLRFTLQAQGKLEERIPAVLPVPRAKLENALRGRSFSFVVRVDSHGRVLHATQLLEKGGEVNEAVAAWLAEVVFAPTPGQGGSQGVVEVVVMEVGR